MKNILINTLNKLAKKLFNNEFTNLDEAKKEVVLTEFIINYN